MKSFKELRQESKALISSKGYLVNASLPLLNDEVKLRSEESISKRALALHLLIATAYNYPSDLAIRWLQREQCFEFLTPDEKSFIEKGKGNAELLKARVEAVWLLTWVTRIHEGFDAFNVCGNNLITLLPNLSQNESSEGFRRRVTLRNTDSIIATLDLLYCLHWAMVEAVQTGVELPSDLPMYAILERRRALEWCCSEMAWDDVVMDT